MDIDQLAASTGFRAAFPVSTSSQGVAGNQTSAGDVTAAVLGTTRAKALGTTTGADTVDAKSAEKTDPALLKQSVSALNEFAQPHFGSIEFSVDSGSGREVLKIIDKETKDVLMQLPSKQALALSQSIGKTHGSLIRDSA